MNTENLNELKYKAYHCAVAHGWHEEDLSNEHFLCLVISELMEAMEADRKGMHAKRDNFEYYMKQRKRDDGEFMYVFKLDIKDSVEDELADTCIRLLDYFGMVNYTIDDSCGKDEVIEEFSCMYKDKKFTESIFNIANSITRYETQLAFVKVIGLAKSRGIDIFWFIKQKMKYNELRPYKHGGKAY